MAQGLGFKAWGLGFKVYVLLLLSLPVKLTPLLQPRSGAVAITITRADWQSAQSIEEKVCG